ncbi:antitoxin [Paramesorhizobium deserti]|uniref:Antitoxin n=1 Tax=Paramesorhizobium deserti TaxID=1494590 RepID=A0A135HQP7_9HYPH|nr:type II toxin-antitoxin system VapB family antitoxin [Paramesorhizobium deserti]KXF75526.1 antitoxin [Paramesorhizobium deserti]
MLKIEDPLTEQLARTLARQTREDIDTAVRHALEERLRRVAAPFRKAVLLEELAAIRHRWNTIPAITQQSADEIMDYDEHGLPR